MHRESEHRRALRALVAIAAVGALAAGCGDDGGGESSSNSGTTSTNSGTTSTNSGTTSTNSGTTSANGGTTSTNGGTTSTNGGTASTNNATTADPCGCDVAAGQRCISDGRCLEPLNRACVVDADCREEETCAPLGEGDSALRVCLRQETPIQVCPGSEGCASAEGALLVGAAKVDMTPPGFEQPRPEFLEAWRFRGNPVLRDGEPPTFWDCGLDQRCEGDPDYPGPDFGEGDGVMQGAWLAGFGNNRPAQRYCPELPEGRCPADQPWAGQLAHDPIWARTVVMRKGDTTVAMVVVDTVGYFYDEVFHVRERLDPSLDVDLIVISATHTHEAPDTMGQWGPGVNGSGTPVRSGFEAWWRAHTHDKVAESIRAAVADLRPARVFAAQVDTGAEDLAVEDTRDPWVFDDDLAVLRAEDAASGETIATLVSWGNHPEALSDENVWITSDFPGPTRDYIERGLPEERDGDAVLAEAVEGVGGVAVYFSGAVGGLITPLRGAVAPNRRGEVFDSGDYRKSDAMGQQLAMRVLSALEDAPEVSDAALSFATREFAIPVENAQFHAAIFGLKLFERRIFNVTTDARLSPDNLPSAVTRASVVRLGGVTFFTVPGEIFPELLVGGYDPSVSYPFTPVIGDPRQVACGPDQLPIACDADADCPDNWGCYGEPRVCQPQGAACGDASACAEGWACAEGRCARPCDADAEACGEGFACDGALCRFDAPTARALGVATPCMLDLRNAFAPDLSAAPDGPYLKERMPGEVIFTLGLGHDELGYIVPPYDFILALLPYLAEADGDHYEETNSAGPQFFPIVSEELGGLIEALER